MRPQLVRSLGCAQAKNLYLCTTIHLARRDHRRLRPKGPEFGSFLMADVDLIKGVAKNYRAPKFIFLTYNYGISENIRKEGTLD